MPGVTYGSLLDQLFGTVSSSCGSPLAKKGAKARGRSIDPERTYRIVTSDRSLRANPELASLLDGAHRKPAVFDPPAVVTLRSANGGPATLRGEALHALSRLGDEYGDELIEELAKRSASRVLPQWLFRLRQLSLRAEGFQGVADDVYGEIPETLATSPSSFTLGTAADIAIDYTDKSMAWDVRHRTTHPIRPIVAVALGVLVQILRVMVVLREV